MSFKHFLLTFIFATLIPLSGFAQEKEENSEEEKEVQHSYSFTISPIHLAFPIFELTSEIKIKDNISVAPIVGFGKMESES